MNHLANSFDIFISVQTLCVSAFLCFFPGADLDVEEAVSAGTAPARLLGSIPNGIRWPEFGWQLMWTGKAWLSCAFSFSRGAFCLAALIAEAFPLLGSIKCSPGSLSARNLSFSG